MNTHNEVITFGRHKGERWTRLPVSYLKWLANSPNTFAEDKNMANAELDRRGTVTPTLDISGHAIDRASLHCRKIWHETAQDGEGLHAWLVRQAADAFALLPDEEDSIIHNGMKFVFERGDCWPTLKTIIRRASK